MKIEEIKTRIKTYHDIAEQELAIAKNERGFHYLDGKASAYRKCMDLLNQLEPRCHMFPEEQPPFNRVILFKFKDNYFELVNYTEHTTFSVDPINWWELSKEGGIK